MATANVNGKQTHLSRFIMQPPSNMVVDHISTDRLDNRRLNLRVCTQRENLAWKRVFNAATPFRGVRMCKGPGRKTNPWQARIKHYDQEIHLGRYPTAEEAAYIYDQAAMQLNGDFARLNVLHV